jgi:DNA-binding transcriptional regulator LsrR (DeoR family)
MTRRDDLRLIAKVADLYYTRKQRQTVISEHLGIHQSTISRLLKRAEKEGIVQVRLTHPAGFHADLEEQLERRFGLSQAIVVDSAESASQLLAHLGSATAVHLASTLKRDDVLGMSSWSASLLAMIDALQPTRTEGVSVVQILGGVGNPSAELHATRLTHRAAQLIGGKPIMLPAPGVTTTKSAREHFLTDPYVQQAVQLFDRLTVALVGIGTVEPSPLLADSGNAFSEDDRKALQALGAVGDVCLRFFDKAGAPVASPLDERVIGISLAQLRQTPRVVAVAGGQRKKNAIHAALRSGVVNVLVTDENVARAIVEDAE